MKKTLIIAVLGCLGVFAPAKTPAAIHHPIEITESKVYPNPFSEEIHIKTTTGSSILITNIIGKVIFENASTVNLVSKVNLSHLPNGVYLIRINANGETITQRIIKK